MEPMELVRQGRRSCIWVSVSKRPEESDAVENVAL
jgi:hypothetical protein